MNGQHHNRLPDWERLTLLVIMLVAAMLRLPWLAEFSLSNDELSALIRSRHDSFSELIRKGVYIDYHPAGVQLFVYFWRQLVGEGVFLFRLPFALLSIGSVWMTYRIGRRWFHPAAGLLTAALFAVFEYPLLYSVLARMYAPGLFFSLAAVWFWTGWIEAGQEGRKVARKDLVGFLTAMLLGPHTHYFVIVFLFSLGCSGFFLLPRKRWPMYTVVCFAGALSFFTEWGVFRIQMATGDLGGWLGPPEPDFLQHFFFSLFNRETWVMLPVMLFVFTGIASRIFKGGFSMYHVLGVIWFFFSFGLGYGYSVLRHPALQSSTLLFTAPFLLISLFGCWPSDRYVRIVSMIGSLFLLVTGVYSTVFRHGFYKTPPFGVFMDPARDIQQWVSDKGSDKVGVVVNVINPDYMEYYFSRMDSPVVGVRYKVESNRDIASLRDWLDSNASRYSYISYAWTNSLHPYELNAAIEDRYPVLVEAHYYFNAESRLYSQGEVSGSRAADWTWTNPFDEGHGVIQEGSIPDGRIMEVDSASEYVTGIRQDIASSGSFRIFMASIDYRSIDTLSDQRLVLEVESDGQQCEWYGIRMNDYNLTPGKWQRVYLARPLPDQCGSMKLKCYVWNKDRRHFYVDNLRAKLVTAVDPYSRK